jgi:hypothetical protein
MDKKAIQEILATTYQRPDWYALLYSVFNWRPKTAEPKPLTLSDTSKVLHAWELGSFYTADERLVGLYELEVAPGIKLERNKVGLRELLRQVYKYEVDAALVVFVQGNKWRLSYISEIRGAQGEILSTAPKRFTYFLGQDDVVRTISEQLQKLIGTQIYLKDLTEIFNVEKLSDDFFKGYRFHYEKFVLFLTGKQIQKVKGKWEEKEVQQPHEALQRVFGGEDKKARDFLKKLLGRLVFLHFLQKKGWLGGRPQFLFDLFQAFEPREKFHSIALKQLFFSTLNEDREKENYRFTIEGKDPFPEPCAVPYLNGGLFENDVPEAANLDFPADYFKEVLDFFASYNFTIDENDPLEQEVGIDPEMLGRIFENLLEENRKKGTYYTPKDVVQYMCQESLIRYLAGNEDQTYKVLNPEGKNSGTKPYRFSEAIEQLVIQNQVHESLTKPEVARAVYQKLLDVKICDPAIGSGAFPMGLLKELFECRRLLYPYLKTSESFVPAEVKKQIIQNNIYGVDLDPGAVDIARLRFWLALVVDEEYPQPLPNLDYKIMQGNSLLESFEGIPLSVSEDHPENTQLTGRLVDGQLDIHGNIKNPQLGLFGPPKKESAFDDKGKTQIKKLADQYFLANPSQKKTIRQKIDEQVVKAVKKVIAEDKKHLEEEKAKRIAYVIQIETQLQQANLPPGRKAELEKALTKKLKEREDWAKLYQLGLEKEARLEASLTNPEKPYFMWHLFFGEVFSPFSTGEELGMRSGPGFDIVIGNPPYVQLAKMKDPYLEGEGYQTFEKTGDLYCLFYEKGIQLLKKGGILSYITSNSWLQTQYGQSLRRYFTTQSQPEVLLNFEDAQVFKTAIVETNILLTRKATLVAKPSLAATVVGSDYRSETGLAAYARQRHTLLTDLPESGWNIGSPEVVALKLKMEAAGKPLKNWPVEIYRGILTGLNEAFILDKETRDRLLAADPKNEEIIKPTLRGRDLKRYSYEFGNQWIISTFPARKIEISDYPTVEKYFLDFGKEKLEQVGNPGSRKKTGNQWFETQDQISYWEEFEKPKIIWGELSDEAKFTFDEAGHYVEATTFLMTGEHLKYLLAVLNSKAAQWYFEKITTTSGMGTNRWKKYKIELLPVPEPDAETEEKIESLVNQILAGKKASQETGPWEAEVDRLVWGLYRVEGNH